MAKSYENDFKVLMVELVKSGRSAREVGDEYGLNSNMIRRWVREYEAKSGDFTKKRELSPEEIELKALRKQLHDVTMERDILKKAVPSTRLYARAFFSVSVGAAILFDKFWLVRLAF